MGLKDKAGRNIKDTLSKEGIATYLGMLIHGFPNYSMSYSPQAHTALSNGPTILECQVDFIVATIEKLERDGVRSAEASKQAPDCCRPSFIRFRVEICRHELVGVPGRVATIQLEQPSESASGLSDAVPYKRAIWRHSLGLLARPRRRGQGSPGQYSSFSLCLCLYHMFESQRRAGSNQEVPLALVLERRVDGLHNFRRPSHRSMCGPGHHLGHNYRT